jgi:hypothetical protein
MADAGAELRAKIREAASPQTLCDLLDGWAPPERALSTRSLDGGTQRALWQRVEGFRPLTLADMVPKSVPALHPVRHLGRNSMPMLTRFEKVLFRGAEQAAAAPAELGGLNVHVTRPLAGPGYCVAVDDAARGEVVIDYTRVPSVAPEGFPPIVDNEHGLRALFYGFTQIDRLRRVSEHVTIGSVARKGRDMGAFFVLCRQDTA